MSLPLTGRVLKSTLPSLPRERHSSRSTWLTECDGLVALPATVRTSHSFIGSKFITTTLAPTGTFTGCYEAVYELEGRHRATPSLFLGGRWQTSWRQNARSVLLLQYLQEEICGDIRANRPFRSVGETRKEV